MTYLLKTKRPDLVLLAGELGEMATDNMLLPELQALILGSKNYNEEAVKAMLPNITVERKEKEAKSQRERKENEARLEREFQMELERERLALEKLKLEAEIKRVGSENSSDASTKTKIRGLDEIVKTIKLLTVKIPTKPEGWNYFFNSLEKAFTSEKVAEGVKAKILICLLGDKAADLLINLEEGEYENYEAVKTVVLREYEPSAKACLENFKHAKRYPEETFVQFATRLKAMWGYYCKLREASDIESINELIVADKLFETLDPETATHVGIRQGEGWFRPKQLARECDNFFSATGKSYSKHYKRESDDKKAIYEDRKAKESLKTESDGETYRFHKRKSEANNKNHECYICRSPKHFKRDCPENKQRKDRLAKVNRVDATDELETDLNNDSIIDEEVEDTVVIAKVGYLGSDVPKRSISDKLCKLDRVAISVNGKRTNALIDSGSEVTVVKESMIPNFQPGNGSSIYLRGIFGPPRKCELVKVPLALMNGSSPNVVHREILCAVTKSLVDNVIMPPQVLNMLRGGEVEKTHSINGGKGGEVINTSEAAVVASGKIHGTSPAVEKETEILSMEKGETTTNFVTIGRF